MKRLLARGAKMPWGAGVRPAGCGKRSGRVRARRAAWAGRDARKKSRAWRPQPSVEPSSRHPLAVWSVPQNCRRIHERLHHQHRMSVARLPVSAQPRQAPKRASWKAGSARFYPAAADRPVLWGASSGLRAGRPYPGADACDTAGVDACVTAQNKKSRSLAEAAFLKNGTPFSASSRPAGSA